MGANQSESGSKDDGFSVHCEQLYSDLISNECPHFQVLSRLVCLLVLLVISFPYTNVRV